MRLALAGFLAFVLAGIAVGQEQIPTTTATGAILRGLDTANGHLVDLDVPNGGMINFERLEITVQECRYPTENPASDAFVYLTIRDIREDAPRFEGWMIASSPAISALDHPRYDVWVLRCKMPEPEPETSDG